MVTVINIGPLVTNIQCHSVKSKSLKFFYSQEYSRIEFHYKSGCRSCVMD